MAEIDAGKAKVGSGDLIASATLCHSVSCQKLPKFQEVSGGFMVVSLLAY